MQSTEATNYGAVSVPYWSVLRSNFLSQVSLLDVFFSTR